MLADGCLTSGLPPRSTFSRESLRWGFTLIAAFYLFSALILHKRHEKGVMHMHWKLDERQQKYVEFKCGGQREHEDRSDWKKNQNIDMPLKSCLQSEGICSVCRRQSRTHQQAVSPVISSTLNIHQRLHMKADRKWCHKPSNFQTATEFWFLHLYLSFWVKDKISAMLSVSVCRNFLEFGQDETS